MNRVALSWSSGKDSAWALHLLRGQPEFEVVALLTSFNSAFGRVAMHAVRSTLVEQQAQRTGLPLWSAQLPWPCSNAIYEERMSVLFRRALEAGITHIAFGDLFLEDIRRYRVQQLQDTGLTPIFPVWDLPTADLARNMIAAGVRAKLTCVDPTRLPSSFAGRDFDLDLLNDLPPGVDPCGENGEFHTFVYKTPVFSAPIEILSGEIAERDGFVFADILPASA